MQRRRWRTASRCLERCGGWGALVNYLSIPPPSFGTEHFTSAMLFMLEYDKNNAGFSSDKSINQSGVSGLVVMEKIIYQGAVTARLRRYLYIKQCVYTRCVDEM